MRILHTMLRVGDLQRSIDFYTDVLGMQLLRTTDRPEQKYTLAFVGYGDESRDARCSSSPTTTASTSYDSAAASATSRSKWTTPHGLRRGASSKGGKVTREAGPVKGGTTVIAFVEDPDGYKIELIERSARVAP